MRLVLFLCATSCTPEPVATSADPVPTEVGGEVGPAGWETRFHREEPWTPSEDQLAALYARCPRIRSVLVERSSENFLKVEVTGERLGEVERVGALLPAGNLATAAHKVRESGALVFPVACESCTIVLGIRMEPGLAACTGPGFSLQISGDAVQ